MFASQLPKTVLVQINVFFHNDQLQGQDPKVQHHIERWVALENRTISKTIPQLLFNICNFSMIHNKACLALLVRPQHAALKLSFVEKITPNMYMHLQQASQHCYNYVHLSLASK